MTARAIGAWSLPARAGRIALKSVRRALRRRAFERGRLAVSEADLEAALAPRTPAEVAAALGRRPLGVASATPDERRRLAAAIAAAHPDARARVMAAADAACVQRFDLLGSGPRELGPEIDWSRDFKSGFRWSPGFSDDLVPVDPGNDADVKLPWELSRCQHFVSLGQAWWFSGDERYARAFVSQLGSWIDANPVMGSINWCNAMEPAIRIVNWLWAATLFRDSPELGEPVRLRLLRSALEHGRFIAANLERIPGLPSSNHYVADLVGLVYLGVLLPELRDASGWLTTGLAGLQQEIERQVGPDGVHYESSLAYHRFVAEMFGSAFALCRQNGVAVADAAWRRLERMLDLHRHRHLAFAHHRRLVLADLIALRQVGIEIVLPVEHRAQIDPGVEAQARADRLPDAFLVDHRQHARHSRVDQRDVTVRLAAEFGRGAREQLGLGGNLGMDLHADHHLPVAGCALDQLRRFALDVHRNLLPRLCPSLRAKMRQGQDLPQQDLPQAAPRLWLLLRCCAGGCGSSVVPGSADPTPWSPKPECGRQAAVIEIVRTLPCTHLRCVA